MKKLLAIVALLCLVHVVKAQSVSLNSSEIEKLKTLYNVDASAKARLAEWQKTADEALNDMPNPIDTIHTEGRLQGDPQKTATQASLKDMRKIYALALAYRLTGDKKYLDKANLFLVAWAIKNGPNGDPIDDTNLDPCVEGFDLIKNALSPGSQALIVNWLTKTAQVEIDKFKPGRETAYNNWHSHRLKVIGEIGFAINDDKLIQYATEGIKKQVEVNLYADGSGMDFKSRDALRYHVYDLEPLIKLAIILKRATNVDYYSYVSPAGSSIKKSVDWLLPYLTGEKTHGEFVNSTVSFDKKRASNGEKDYVAGSLFNPKNGVATLELAEYFDPSQISLIKKLKETDQAYPDWQLVLNKVKR